MDKQKNKMVIIINGRGGVGKDTLCDMAARHFSVRNISSITPIKEIAMQNGWKGDKTKKSRKFLSDLKRLFVEYNDLPTTYLVQQYQEFLKSGEQILFVHIRETEEIEKFKAEVSIRCITLLVKRSTMRRGNWGNASDDEVENYDYDYYFQNDSPLPEAEEEFAALLTGWMHDLPEGAAATGGAIEQKGNVCAHQEGGPGRTKEQLHRTELLLGEEAMWKLARSRVAVFGVGGVGGYVAEVLARSGVGAIDLIDSDCVSLSNLNRQIIATGKTVGRQKTEVMRERIREIDPDIKVTIHNCFFLPENSGQFDFTEYSYVVDAVDTVTAKIELILSAQKAGVPVISSMGAGNKLHPEALEIADIYETSVCPLARVMRHELKKRGVCHLKVVYSKEQPLHPESDVPGSVAFVPSAAGVILAGEVIRELAGKSLEA